MHVRLIYGYTPMIHEHNNIVSKSKYGLELFCSSSDTDRSVTGEDFVAIQWFLIHTNMSVFILKYFDRLWYSKKTPKNTLCPKRGLNPDAISKFESK
jgi:hypothetical protein